MTARSMETNRHPGTEEWIQADGAAAVAVRRSLIAWLEAQDGGEAEQIAAIAALIDLAKHCAKGHPQYAEGLAELLYQAADEVAAGDG